MSSGPPQEWALATAVRTDSVSGDIRTEGEQTWAPGPESVALRRRDFRHPRKGDQSERHTVIFEGHWRIAKPMPRLAR